jgi:hypothetical protein
MHVCEELPAVIDAEGNRTIYYMREDVVRWIIKLNDSHFQPPTQEIITIEVKYGDITKSSTMPLSEDQMVGIAYGISAMKNNKVTLRSSATKDLVEVENIAQHSLIYRLPITQP